MKALLGTCSLHLPIPPYISLYLPISPYIQDDMKAILGTCSHPERQTCLFSATLPKVRSGLGLGLGLGLGFEP